MASLRAASVSRVRRRVEVRRRPWPSGTEVAYAISSSPYHRQPVTPISIACSASTTRDARAVISPAWLVYNPRMPNTREGIARAIEARSPITIDGTSFTIELADFKESLPYEVKHIEVLFMALSPNDRHNGKLHLGPDSYTDDELADLAVQTIRDIAAGKLPPGTVSLV
jgi:hypothetical protein